MNWSLILNVFLLMGVVVAIYRTIKIRKQQQVVQTATALAEASVHSTPMVDEVLAVRKVEESTTLKIKPSLTPIRPNLSSKSKMSFQPKIEPQNVQPVLRSSLHEVEALATSENMVAAPSSGSIMMFLLAKSNRQLAGYELLQAVLSAGFRFGEGNLFHRHQFPNGQGDMMCSLAAATPSGVFDMQNIGGFSVHGLCLFMQASGDQETDAERFDIMMDTAKMLSDSLDTHLLDDLREPMSEQSIARYHQKLNLTELVAT